MRLTQPLGLLAAARLIHRKAGKNTAPKLRPNTGHQSSDPPATIHAPPLSIRSARFWTNSQDFTGRTKTRHAPPLSIRWHRSPIRTRWTITDGQLFAVHGSRYV